MSADGEWGALPAIVTPLWRAPSPAVCDEDGQFSDAATSDDEKEVACNGPNSFQTVVAAPATSVPRLALSDMAATPQPLPVSVAEGWQVPALPGRLSRLSLEESGRDQLTAEEPSVEGSPRSVADTASVSLRSYLDPAAAAAVADLTGDLTDCETLAELAELAETSRTVRREPCRWSSGRRVDYPAGGGQPQETATRAADTGELLTNRENTRLTTETQLNESAVVSDEVRVALERGADEAGTPEEAAMGKVTTSGCLAVSDDFCHGGVSVLTREAGTPSMVSLSGYETPSREGGESDTKPMDRLVAGTLDKVAESDCCRTAAALTERGYSDCRTVTTGPDGCCSGGAASPTGRARANDVNQHQNKAIAAQLATSTLSVPLVLPDPPPKSTQSILPNSAVVQTSSAPDRECALPSVPDLFESGHIPAGPVGGMSAIAAAEPSSSTACDGPPCPVHGSPRRQRAVKRSPARRLSFTLESPSPLLVEYYIKHPEERQQLSESMALMDLETPANLGGQKPPSVSPGGSPSSSAPPAAETGLERTRRRWSNGTGSAAELRAALSSRPATDPPPPPLPAAAGRQPSVPLGWGAALHSLSAAPMEADLPEERAIRWQYRAPPTVMSPSAVLQLPLRPAGSPSECRRRSGALGYMPPASFPPSPPRRSMSNLDSHASQCPSPVRGDIGWGPPPPPPLKEHSYRLSPAAATATATATATDTATATATATDTATATANKPTTSTATHDVFSSPALGELSHLLALHERQMVALVEQQRCQRRDLEVACRRREDALLERLRRQLAAAEMLAGRPPSPPSSLTNDGSGDQQPPEMAAGDWPTSAAVLRTDRAGRRHTQPACRRSSPSSISAPQSESDLPSPYERTWESGLLSPPAARELRQARSAADAVPTPVARRLTSPSSDQHPVIVPPEVFSQGMQERYAKVTAAVRGYLTRRLMRTEKVQSLIAAAKESMVCALRLQREVDLSKQITKQDVELHERLVNQVRGACYSLHQLFIVSSPQQRLAVIAADRAARAHAAERRRSGEPAGRLSRATLLALQRKKHRVGSSPRSRLSRVAASSARGWSPSGAVPAPVSSKPRSPPAGRPRRVTTHSPRAGGSHSGLSSGRTAATSGRSSRTSRSLSQLTNIYAPNVVRRVKSSQSQLLGGVSTPSQAAEPKRRHRTGRAWR